MSNPKRIVLRNLREGDLHDITALWNDPAVQSGLFVDHVHPRPPQFPDKLHELVNKDAFYAVIETKETGEVMGTICVWVPETRNRDGMVAKGLLPRYYN
ncbi:hypothetical protein HWV62_36535 [Athelia sp. TMB]|nr:hypothetical protein HWV62_36535 [Athelia sp. TMB]